MIDETPIRNDLAQRTIELDEIEETLRKCVQAGSTRAPWQLKDLMKRLSNDLQHCETLIEGHANDDLRLSDDLLKVVANTMRAINNVMSGIVLAEIKRAI